MQMAQTFTTPEQKELFDLLQNGKVYFKSQDFARSLATCKNPSSNQMFYVRKLITDTNNYHSQANTAPVLQTVDSTLKIDMTKIMGMFNHARQHLKRPKITLMMKCGKKVRFSFDKSQTSLYMVEMGSYNSTYGRINISSGDIFLKRLGHQHKDELMQLIKDFSENPQKMAILHGQLTGNCCFCSLPLSDPKSLKLGYGPICADHYRLPYVKINDFTAIGDWANILEQPV